jgi:hypothetical protein
MGCVTEGFMSGFSERSVLTLAAAVVAVVCTFIVLGCRPSN